MKVKYKEIPKPETYDVLCFFLERGATIALHWQLDVSFGEDAQRNRKDNGPANIAVLRRRALDVARLDHSKGSLTVRLKRAGWNDEFMLKLLSQMR